jgi:hypothetical protein
MYYIASMTRGKFWAAVAALVFGLAPAWPHHGSTGVYNFSRPFYVEGIVSKAEYAFPHAEILVETGLSELPPALPDLSRISAAEGRDTGALLRVVPDAPMVVISFDGTLTGRINGHASRPQAGDRVRAIVYRRDSRDRYLGEYRVMMIELRNGEQLVLGRRAYFRELG